MRILVAVMLLVLCGCRGGLKGPPCLFTRGDAVVMSEEPKEAGIVLETTCFNHTEWSRTCAPVPRPQTQTRCLMEI